jgi:hypothetical protein
LLVRLGSDKRKTRREEREREDKRNGSKEREEDKGSPKRH